MLPNGLFSGNWKLSIVSTPPFRGVYLVPARNRHQTDTKHRRSGFLNAGATRAQLAVAVKIWSCATPGFTLDRAEVQHHDVNAERAMKRGFLQAFRRSSVTVAGEHHMRQTPRALDLARSRRPDDSDLLVPAVEAHQNQFGSEPHQSKRRTEAVVKATMA